MNVSLVSGVTNMWRAVAMSLFCVAIAGALVASPQNEAPDLSGLVKNGSATIQIGPNGHPSLLLTPNLIAQAGSAFTREPALSGRSYRFRTFFQFRMTDPGGIGAADGITFTIQTEGPQALGGGGGDLGYSGIQPSVGVNFVTFQNAGDIANNSVGVVTNGNYIGVGQEVPYGVTSCQPPTGVFGCMGNGDLWSVWIDYDGSVLRVAVADNSITRPQEDLIDYPIDVFRILQGQPAYAGFTGATGNGVENHQILSWSFQPTL